MAQAEPYHVPAMGREAVDLLAVGSGIYVDATLGGGGHTEMILERLQQGFVVGIDTDRDALDYAGERLRRFDRLRMVQGNFRDLERLVHSVPGVSDGVAGILMDLGLSRHQALSPERGFSYNARGPLDMRFDQAGTGPTVEDLIRRSSEADLQRIIRDYGEERFWRRIGRRIAQRRHRLSSTADLADAVRSAVPRQLQGKALMRVFQAFRIALNDELDSLSRGLQQAASLLIDGGRLVVIAYHSLEDRIVKQTLRGFQTQGVLEILTRRPLRPGPEEVAANPSARSARLRAAVKLMPAVAA